MYLCRNMPRFSMKILPYKAIPLNHPQLSYDAHRSGLKNSHLTLHSGSAEKHQQTTIAETGIGIINTSA